MLGFDKIGAGLLVASSQGGGAVSRLVLGAGVLAFATGIGAYDRVGIFFVISADVGGPREAEC